MIFLDTREKKRHNREISVMIKLICAMLFYKFYKQCKLRILAYAVERLNKKFDPLATRADSKEF